jgi:hypothetical protein
MKKLIAILTVMSVFSVSFAGCASEGEEPEEKQPEEEQEEVVTEPEETVTPVTAEAATFAEWEDIDVSYTPQVPGYEIEADLSNVMYSEEVLGPDRAKELLAQNGFVVTKGYNNEFFSIYEDNRYQYIPNFVTTDSVLHTYHLYFNSLLKNLEETELYDLAYDISKEMQKVSLEQYEALSGTDWEVAAKRNVAYFSVPVQILSDGADEIPEIVKEEVETELAMIEAHEGLGNSPTMEPGYMEDYSQYVPRGHYTKTEDLKKYFKSLMWYGRMTFRLKQDDETRSAVLMVEALKNSDDLRNDWKRLYEPIGFFVGDADDLVYLDYVPVAEDVFGEDFSYQELPESGKLDEFIKRAKELRDPGVNSMPVWGTILNPGEGVEERTEDVKGFRFLGQRFTIDAFIFQKLICREVGNKDGTMPCPSPNSESRMLPDGLDIPAAFTSDLAYQILEDMGETEYEKYPENMEKVRQATKETPKERWTSNLYWGWLYTLRTLLDEYGEGYPSFMRNEAWNRKELMTFLSSWAELKHDTILYAKQAYAELGGAPMPEERDDRGYVEPNPELYARLASLTKLTKDGLKERNILSAHNEGQLDKLYELCNRLKQISVKELENTERTEDDYEFIRTYGGSLEHFWYETFSEEEKEQGNLLNNNPAPIIADVATDPNCCVLEVGTGYVEPIYAVVPIEGELRVAKGGVYSYYEFSWPMDDRLTDEKWRDEILTDFENPPERPDWQEPFLANIDE